MNQIVAVLIAASISPLAAAQTITWLTSDLPPHSIAEGQFAGLGIKDQQLRLISDQVPEPRSVAGYTACSNQALGRAMIARLDALQGDPALWQQWMEPLRRWLEPGDFATALAAQP